MFTIDSIYSFVIPLLVAAITGYLIGYFNQYLGNEGGTRTFALVTIGSTLVTLVSIYFFTNSDQPWLADPARISASVVSALSFLGTGLIWMSEERRTSGMSSATNLWITALFGMLLGSGSRWSTMLAFWIIVAVFMALDILEVRYAKRKWENAEKEWERQKKNEKKIGSN